ncbi:MAG: peptidylprolyl isomerase [Gemmatimonadaceae bacterium]
MQPAIDEHALAQLARVLRIEDTRRDEPSFLDSMMVGGDARARSRAALASGRIGARVHLSRLRMLATDPDTGVAANALFALGLMKDRGAVPRGVEALRAPGDVAIEGAWLLGELGEAGRAAITRALADSGVPPHARGALLLAAARLRPVPVAAVTPWLTSPDSGLAWKAAYALARTRNAAGVRALLAVAASDASQIREQVARGIGLAAAGDSLGTDARRALATLSHATEAHVRVNAVRALASYGRIARAEILAALGDADAAVRLVAAQSLEQVLDSSATDWATALRVDTTFLVQRTIAVAAAQRGITSEHASAWRTSTEWQHRAAVLDIDARGHADSSLNRLELWRRDSDERVRAAATGAVAALTDSAAVRSRVRATLRRALEDADVGVRTAALNGLAHGASDADLIGALDAHARAARDTDADARMAFWSLVDSALAARGSAIAASTLRRLDAVSRPTHPLERAAAARIPRFASWRDDTGEARPMAWYLARAREATTASVRIARIWTERGEFALALFTADAPLTVHNFVALAQRGYFDGQRFHRVVPNFVVQGGDPRGDGSGGPGHAIRDELNRRRYLRGTLGMALSGPNTGGSQFFIAHSPQPHLDGGYTVFGQLIEGADVFDRIAQGDRIVRITVR